MRALNEGQWGQLRSRLTQTINSYVREHENRSNVTIKTTRDGPVIHVDNGSNVLAVAHMDYVAYTGAPYYVRNRNQVWAGQLDDRLGIWTILDYLPTQGINVDVLLTDSEESGASTAGYFEPPAGKQYNWMFQFDRRGETTVMYDYETKELRELLVSYGFQPAQGSFSDICRLEHLGCKGFNIGTGYYHEHSNHSFADVDVLLRNVARLKAFYDANKDVHLTHERSAAAKWWGVDWDKFYANYDPKTYQGETGKITQEELDAMGAGLGSPVTCFCGQEFDADYEIRCPQCGESAFNLL